MSVVKNKHGEYEHGDMGVSGVETFKERGERIHEKLAHGEREHWG